MSFFVVSFSNYNNQNYFWRPWMKPLYCFHNCWWSPIIDSQVLCCKYTLKGIWLLEQVHWVWNWGRVGLYASPSSYFLQPWVKVGLSKDLRGREFFLWAIVLGRNCGHWSDIGQILGRHWVDIGQTLESSIFIIEIAVFLMQENTFQVSRAIRNFFVLSCKKRLFSFLI